MDADIGFELNQLSEIQRLSKELKKGFKKTETVPWMLSSFSAELSFQVTHVICSLLNKNGFGSYVLPLDGIDKGINDEIADVLFNIMNTLNYLDLSVSDILSDEIISRSSPLFKISDSNIHVMNLAIQAGNLWDASFRGDGYKHKVLTTDENISYIQKSIAGILINLLILAKIEGIDVFESFNEMFKDASSFLTNYKDNTIK